MQISSYTNQYQALQTKQNPITVPGGPSEPKYSKDDIYEASKGNLTLNDDGRLDITPQGELNIANAKNAKEEELSAKIQEEKDSNRATFTKLLETSSKKSRIEIYFATASDGEIDMDNQTLSVFNTLRDVQKQNNMVQAYATYKELQENIPDILK